MILVMKALEDQRECSVVHIGHSRVPSYLGVSWRPQKTQVSIVTQQQLTLAWLFSAMSIAEWSMPLYGQK